MISILLVAQTASSLPFVSPVFGSHMVLQRDKPNAIWGWTTPGEKVTVSILKVKETATADATGKWMVRIKPPKVGGPYRVSIFGSQSVDLDDVLVGDVYICSGQSNMEMGISQVKDAKTEIANANNPNIRLFAVPKVPSLTPKQFVKADWLPCTSENIVKGGWGGFSAVAYFFGRDMNKELNVPIGLIHTSWGGTPAEAWTSAEGIAPVKDFQKQVDAVTEMAKPGAMHTADMIENWAKGIDGDSSGVDVNDSTWEKVQLPNRFGRIGLAQHRGEVWFRKTIDLPNPLPAGDAQLTTGSNDGIDINYVNGVRTDFGSSVLNWRNKPVPAGVLKPGKNVIAIRFVGTNGPNAGFTYGGIDGLNLRIGGERYSLMGDWQMKKGFELKGATPMPALVEDNPNWPTTLYNGMMAPLMPMAIKGALWYQGESNVGRGEQYSRLLPAMITDWRKGFGQGDFPFFAVQLANYGGQHDEPINSGWAELREAQVTGVSRVKNADYACIVDIGEGKDIHPKNKQDVGHRLALKALRMEFNKGGESSGPTFKSAKPLGQSILVTFDHANGLEMHAGKNSGFQVAGADGKFVWADATIQGNSVVLAGPGVNEPLFARYAWDDDPIVTLFNNEGLPAVPFRTK